MILYLALYFFNEDDYEISILPSDSLKVYLKLLPDSESFFLYLINTTELQFKTKLVCIL